MTVFRKLRLNAVFLGISALLMGSGAAAFEPITIVDQQSFAAGGKVETAPGTFEANRPTEAGQSIHGDHAYFFLPETGRCKAARHDLPSRRDAVFENLGNYA